MIVIYAEKEDMGIKFTAALGGINYKGDLITTDTLSLYQDEIKKNLADKQGYLKTKYKNKDYVITWGWGHFGTLKDIKDYNPDYDKWYKIPLPFFPKRFESKRKLNNNPNPKAREHFRKRDDRQFEIVKKLFNDPSCEYIINATDWEREGELIFAYTYDLAGSSKPYFRLRNNAKTQDQIRKDFDNLVDAGENYPYILAARARSIADWVIGINMTIAATLYLSTDRSLLNVGRVFTPTLALIVNRENEIRGFKPETTYNIGAEFSLPSGDKYIGRLQQEEFFKTEQQAQNFLKALDKEGIIIDVTKKTEKKNPPMLYNTTSLQVDANKIYGFTLDETLNIAQKLYENGYITYPRVDSAYLTEDKKSEIPALISRLLSMSRYSEFASKASPTMPDKYFNDSKVSGHDAIIITDVFPTKLTSEQSKIYDLIARRMIMAVSPSMETEKTTVITRASDGVDSYDFKTTGSSCKELGFMAVHVNKPSNSDSELPRAIKKDLNVSAAYGVYDQTSTPPARYTEGSLITAMENCGRKMEDKTAKEYLKKSEGIGRPSTRASIVERLVSVGFIERKKTTLYPTEKGLKAIDAITIDEIKSPILTAKWEQDLDEIESSNAKESVNLLKIFLSNIKETATKWCNEMEKNKVNQTGANTLSVNCPCCGKPMINFKDNYACSGYKDGCKFSIRKTLFGKKISEDIAATLIANGITPKLNGFKSSKGKAFSAALILEPGFICESCGAIQRYSENGCYKCGSAIRQSDNQKVVAIKF